VPSATGPILAARETQGRPVRGKEPSGPTPAAEGRWPGFPAGWTALCRSIERCERCRLHEYRTHVVIYRGSPAPTVVFIGEAPGAEEDRQGKPFVGRSGARLDRAIERLPLPMSAIGILNIVKCRPPENRFDRTAAKRCRPYLDRQLELLRPRLLVTLGAQALRALDPSAPPVTRAAGAPRKGGPIPLFPLLHPAAVLHAPRYRARWEQDVAALARFLTASGLGASPPSAG
jgi:uracil-DNA glycosylase